MQTKANKLSRYEILRELGRGATGTVHAARDRVTRVAIALKVIDPALLHKSTANFAELFLKDARSAWRLRHRNIVAIHDAGEADGTAYVAMEMLDGDNLRKILDERTLLPIAHSIRTAVEIASALAYAHQQGVVHRALKPSNVIILRSGGLKITDFGIGHVGEAAILSGTSAGSLSYMSPEQIRGGPVDARSDVFSLGVLLYEMVTRRLPFNGHSPTELLQQIAHAEPPLPSDVNPHVPRALDGIVLRMLAAQPDERAPSAQAVLRDLERLEEQLGVPAAETAEAGDEPPPSVRDIPPRTPDTSAFRARDASVSPEHDAGVFAERDAAAFRMYETGPLSEPGAHAFQERPISGYHERHEAAFGFGEAHAMQRPERRVAPYVLGLVALIGAAGVIGWLYFGDTIQARFSGADIAQAPATTPRAAPSPAPSTASAPPPAATVGPNQSPSAPPAPAQAVPPPSETTKLEQAQPSDIAPAPAPAIPRVVERAQAPQGEQSATPPPARRATDTPSSEAARTPQTAEQAPAAQPAKTAKVVVSVAPRGEIYVDGKYYGSTPPLTTIELEPGIRRIEVRYGSRRPYLNYMNVQPGEVRRIRHDFG